jgi:hypothetical protein
MLALLDSLATLPVSTGVLTGRVARLSSKSDILWTRVSQMNYSPLHIDGLYVRHLSMYEACVLQETCFQVKTSVVSGYGTVKGFEPLSIRADMSGI